MALVLWATQKATVTFVSCWILTLVPGASFVISFKIRYNTFEVLVGVLGAAYPRFLDIKISPCGLDAGVINARALILLTLKYKS